MIYLIFCPYVIWLVISFKVHFLANINFSVMLVTCYPKLHNSKYVFSLFPLLFNLGRKKTNIC